MKFLKYLLLGVVFGITLTKAEIVSWYRIYEMFHFQAFHMYGVIGSAVVIGVIFHLLVKRFGVRNTTGEKIQIQDKQFSIPRYLIGGTIFGMGWAMTGACPGPLFILVGNGISVVLVVIASALLGTYVYGLIRNKLPH
jgi:uncharacterized membrane protein YedE/YeeE